MGKKKVERPGHRVKAPSRAPGDGGVTPGSGKYRIRTGTRPERSWGVTPSWLLDYPACAAADGRSFLGKPLTRRVQHHPPGQESPRRHAEWSTGGPEWAPDGALRAMGFGILQIGQAPCLAFSIPSHPIPGFLPPATVSDIAHRSLLTAHTRFLLGGDLSLVGLTLTARAAVRRHRIEKSTGPDAA